MSAPIVALRRFRLGDRVALDDLAGEVVTLRNVGGDMQVLQIRAEDGGLLGLSVRIEDGQTLAAPVDMGAAVALAQAVVARREPAMAVTLQIQTLATALLAAIGEAA